MYICVNYCGQLSVLAGGHDPSLLKYPQGESKQETPFIDFTWYLPG